MAFPDRMSGRPIPTLALVLGVALLLPACARSPAQAAGQAIDKAFELAAAGRKAEAVAAFDGAIASEGFAELPAARRFEALRTEGEAVESLGDHAKAHALFVRASELRPADLRAWQHRLWTAWSAKDYGDATHCITVAAQRWPAWLRQIPGQSIWMVQMALGDDAKSEQLRFELFEALHAAHWKDRYMDPGIVWRDYARMLLARKDVAKARQVAAAVTDTRIAISMRVDRRFDAITQGNPAFDIEALAAANLERARSESARQPDDLEKRIRVITALLDLARYDEALRVADAILAETADGSGPRRYKDFDEHCNWLLNGRERALFRLGRVNGAVAELERAARQPENGQVNVSQSINLGVLYDELGRPADALSAVAKVGEMTPFGRMQLESVQLWASIQLHDVAAVSRHMTYLSVHRADAMDTWTNALVLTGQDDEAAALLIERLRSERWRSEALLDAQDFAEVRRLPLEAASVKQWRRIHARPDVRAAILAVGRVETFKLDPSAS